MKAAGQVCAISRLSNIKNQRLLGNELRSLGDCLWIEQIIANGKRRGYLLNSAKRHHAEMSRRGILIMVVAPSLTPDGLQWITANADTHAGCSSLSHPGWLTMEELECSISNML